MSKRKSPRNLLKALQDAPTFLALKECVSRGESGTASGLWGSFHAYLIAALAEECRLPILYVAPSIEDAEDAYGDLSLFRGGRKGLRLFPAFETLPTEEALVSHEIFGQRLHLLQELVSPKAANKGAGPAIIITCIQALLQPTPSKDELQKGTLELKVGQRHNMEYVASWLVDRGFDRENMVEMANEFSIRGGILDVFPLANERPLRIEFFGDMVESIREFEIGSQRSTDYLDACQIAAPRRGGLAVRTGGHSSLLDYLPADTRIALRELIDIQDHAEKLFDSLAAPGALLSFEEACLAWQKFPTLGLSALPAGAGPRDFQFAVRSTQRFGGDLASVAEELTRLCEENRQIVVYCNNAAERDRLNELLADTKASQLDSLTYGVGHLSAGFELPELGLAFVGHHEIFNRYARRRMAQPRQRSTPIESFLELEKGDYVVHVAHGIGKYLGLERLERSGELQEYLVLEYAGAARLFVPTTKIDLVQKYIGVGQRRPTLNVLGGRAWEKRKEAVKAATKDLAVELLELQAMRKKMPGIAYPDDTEWQREFEAAFLYEETEDQLVVAEEIKTDMTSPRPMDRLVCGDVGYGKTELAMRAAFRVVMHGKQVGILVPTTILAQQHYRTFRERMADYPVRIEMLSRFRTRKEQADTVESLKEGKVDIIIGTHRLLSADVEFKDLGLIIIDEEQRFGVKHKEHLKMLRAMVDVLTMTATPIPRTLHMSLVGIKDISSLNTPPEGRLAVKTEVCRYDGGRIRNAILRERNRDGQVFFVHNRVYNIERVAEELRQLVPEATFAVGHGQMREHQLERRMAAFVDGKTDVLVSTTIIESGLDIPNANTIFVNRADCFGLADLHQLRGRVGRYKHRAYAYFLLPEDRPISPKSVKRLKAIEDYSELGAGFKIAMSDLEIRGAGNILGMEQHGHIAAVGYDLYCKLLDQAVRELQNEEVPEEREVDIDLGLPAYLPEEYVPGHAQKIDGYRKLSTAKTADDLEAAEQELLDRFGRPMPDPVTHLIRKHALRIAADPLEISYVGFRRDHLLIHFRNAARIQSGLSELEHRIRLIDEHTLHLLLPRRDMDPLEAAGYLESALTGQKGAGHG